MLIKLESFFQNMNGRMDSVLNTSLDRQDFWMKTIFLNERKSNMKITSHLRNKISFVNLHL